MKTLIITAHPSSKGFTHQIAQRFAATLAEVEIIDLYQDSAEDFLHFEDSNNIALSDKSKMYQAKIAEAQNLVFIHPVWWGSVPAILKNFCDIVFSADFAFRYEKGKSVPKGLLKGKKGYVFMTADADTWMFSFLFTSPKKFWANPLFGILPFSGVQVKHLEVFGGMRKASEEKRHKWLQKVEKIAQKTFN